MSTNQLLNEEPATIAQGLLSAINQDLNSEAKNRARTGVRYYNSHNDILENRVFYMDDNGLLKEDKFASNIRIPHGFFPEQVDQKVQYLLSNPLEVTTEDETFQTYLDEYYNEDMQVFLQEMVEGGSQKGFEYAFARTSSEDKLSFQVADSLHVFPIYTDNMELKRLCRYFKKKILVDAQEKTFIIAEVWDEKQVWFFKAEEGKPYSLDLSREMNPRPHILAQNDKGDKAYRDYGEIPFYRYANNKDERTDLEPIKSLIDDYDLMNAFLSNNLQDFAEALYVVKGFKGDDLSKLRLNAKSKKVVGVGTDGGVDIQTVTIPVEARKTKMDLDKDNIYKFGLAFDSSQVGDGNITNIVIKSRYTLLNMKANKTEVRLRKMLKWMNELIVADINRRYGSAYNASDIEITITREAMVNENDIVANEKVEAETKQLIIQTILAAAPRIGDEETLKLICEQFDLAWEEVQAKVEEQDYTPALDAGTDPEGVDNGDGTGQVAEGNIPAGPVGQPADQ